MKLSYLIKHGYLKDTKKGYVIKKNFSLLRVSGLLDKPLIIPDYSIVDLTGGDNNGKPIKFSHQVAEFVN